MPSKYLGNPKYIKQLEDHYGTINATEDAYRQYVNLSCQDKVILSQQNYEIPFICCPHSDLVLWNTWEEFDWDIDDHAWNTVWENNI